MTVPITGDKNISYMWYIMGIDYEIQKKITVEKSVLKSYLFICLSLPS